MIRFDSLPSMPAFNPNQCGILYVPPAYSDIHPVKSFILKCMAIFAVVAACLLLVSLAGWVAMISNTSAVVIMPFSVGLGVFAGFNICNIITEEIR